MGLIFEVGILLYRAIAYGLNLLHLRIEDTSSQERIRSSQQDMGRVEMTVLIEICNRYQPVAYNVIRQQDDLILKGSFFYYVSQVGWGERGFMNCLLLSQKG